MSDNRDNETVARSPLLPRANFDWDGNSSEWVPRAANSAISAGENHIGEVGGRLKRSSAEFTRPADTTAYVARDVVSNSTGGTTLMQFDLARVAGGSGYISKARLVTNNKTPTPRLRLWLYTISNPTVAADNAPFTLLWSNRANRIGYIDFPALASEDPTNSDSASSIATSGTAFTVPLAFICAANDTKLYGILETLDGFPPASSQQFFVELTADLN